MEVALNSMRLKPGESSQYQASSNWAGQYKRGGGRQAVGAEVEPSRYRAWSNCTG